ncbi:MAG: MG2 domain-containing protein [Planctomycetota bacterium]
MSFPWDDREEAKQAYQQGRYRDAFEIFERLALEEDADLAAVSEDLLLTARCLQQLNRTDEIDGYLERILEAHPGSWRVLKGAAQVLASIEHYGYRVSGELRRGQHRGGGDVVNVQIRDRAQILQWMDRAIPLLARDDVGAEEQADFYRSLADWSLGFNRTHEAWRLQILTDLEKLPDPEPGWYGWRGFVGAPVDENGDPVVYAVPESWEAARSDGERWRFAIEEVRRLDPERSDEVDWEIATFARELFGVATLAQGGWWQPMAPEDDDSTSILSLSTLTDDETIARLASGIRRFRLPEGYNHLAIFRRLSEKGSWQYGMHAGDALGQIYEARRQYPKAAAQWKALIEKHGVQDRWKRSISQIEDNWCRFEPLDRPAAAGTGAEVGFRFRNGRRVTFTARRIDVDRLLRDVMAYMKGKPKTLEWSHLQVEDLGHRLIHGNGLEYVAEGTVATWSLELDPADDHFDRVVTIETPLQDGGAYLVEARMEDGNRSEIVMWVSDLAIVHKPLGEKQLYFVADALTGKPIEKAHLELFGYRYRQVGRRNQTIEIEQFAEFTDAQGEVILDSTRMEPSTQWLVMARQGDRLAYMGFEGVWFGSRPESHYEAIKAFGISDRPVYRPGDTVKYKFWVRRARFDDAPVGVKPGTKLPVSILDPLGNAVGTSQLEADSWGGLAGELELPDDAKLGVYSISCHHYGAFTIRVEEYKKPEFEVQVEAPKEPLRLGESFEATINARYYFGEPVREARVHYKVMRSSHTGSWFPSRRWDWLYGPGYWWLSCDVPWYPGWMRWGCRAPVGWWLGWQPDPPEIVAEGEAPIGEDGTLRIPVDTQMALEQHPDKDHSYQIVAEVVDASRRTIVGTGTVEVTREPFRVVTWLDRGWLKVGDDVEAHAVVSAIGGKPLELSGSFELYRITYDAKRQPEETEVERWDVEADANGGASIRLSLGQSGQYRLVARFEDDEGREVTSGVIFTALGTGDATADFRFDDLELVPDRSTYRPGETMKLQINTDRLGSTVLLFVRPEQGRYPEPRLIEIRGRSTVVDVPIEVRDMPNFFVEALTVSSGQVHTVTRSVHVPPEKRVLDVAVEPAALIHGPGETDEVTLRLTGPGGEPFVGSMVLSVYDKAVEYISGGSNVPDVREFFWKWLRYHYPQTNTNLDRWSTWLTRNGEQTLMPIGMYGNELLLDADGIGLSSGESAREAGSASGKQMAQSRTASRDAPMAEASSLGAFDSAGVAALVEPTVRTDFRDTAYWNASLETDAHGRVSVQVPLPDSLTTWKLSAWGLGEGTRVGAGEAEIVTRKDVLVRLQAPRFFIEKDEVVLSANVHNYLQSAKLTAVRFDLLGDVLEPIGDVERTIEVAAGGEARVDLRVKVAREGEALVRVYARTDEDSDAMELRFPAYIHGAMRTESWSGTLRPGVGSDIVRFRVPRERREDQTELIVRTSPTLTGALVDALPYLVDYPYGCTEQTLNRFLPTVITQKVLRRLGVDLAAVREHRSNLNAQEIGDAAERAKRWQIFGRNPVFDEAEVTKMVKEGVDRLTDMQNSDGGWGWFSGYGEHSYPHTTATVVRGLLVARENDIALVSGLIESGIAWLERYQTEQLRMLANAKARKYPWKEHTDNLDALVYSVLVRAGKESQKMQDNLHRDRTHLSAYSLGLYGLALEELAVKSRLKDVLTMLDQLVVEDEENQTAYLDLAAPWWYW